MISVVIPALNEDGHIAGCIEALESEECDCEIIIADRGCYLIGMKSPMPEPFCNMPWSTRDIFAEAVRTLNHLGNKLRSPTCPFRS